MPGGMACTTAVGRYPMTGRTSETRRASVTARGPRTRVPDVPPNTSPVGETANGPSLARGPRLDPIGDAELRRLADARGKLVAEMTVLRARMKSDIHAVLTPEQRDKLKQHSEQRRRVSSGPSPAGASPESTGLGT